MIKEAGPPLSLKKLPLKLCPECNGNGTVKPMFHELLCGRCNGLGGVHHETGDTLSTDNVIMQLRVRLRERAEAERILRRRLADITDESAGRGYGVGGSRHHGD